MDKAEYVCGCRSCGNYCLVVEPVRASAGEELAEYSDGYLAGWDGVQTEVVTCPDCGIVMSWRKNCSPAEQLRKRGDLARFNLRPAAWGPAEVYWDGFRQYERNFHPEDEKPGRSGPPRRLTRAPEASQQWALRKRGALALGLLWLDNDRERKDGFFGGTKPGRRDEAAKGRRALLLRALIEAAEFGTEKSKADAIHRAEWHREAGEWDDALLALGHKFEDPVLAARAKQLRDLVAAKNSNVVRWEATAKPKAAEPAAAPPPPAAEPPPPPKAAAKAPPPPAPAPAPAPEPFMEINFEPVEKPKKAAAAPAPVPPPAEVATVPMELQTEAPPDAEAAAPAEAPAEEEQALPSLVEAKTPRALLATVMEVLGTIPADTLTKKYIPRPYGAMLRTLAKGNGWDEDSFAVSVVRGFARAHGWPDDVDAESRELLEIFEVDDKQLDYLALGFQKATWDKWAFDVPADPPPKRGR